MGLYNDLTDEQKADLALYDTALRGILSSLVATSSKVNAVNLNEWSKANVDPIIDGLDAAEVVPNSTGLGGAKDLTKEDLQALRTLARQLLGMLATNQALLAKTVGVNMG
jgi:hypothetical protein